MISLYIHCACVALSAYYAPNIIFIFKQFLLIDCRFGRTQMPNNWIRKTNETINTSIVDWDMVLFLKAEAICQLYRESSTVYDNTVLHNPTVLHCLHRCLKFFHFRLPSFRSALTVDTGSGSAAVASTTHTHRTRTRTQIQQNVQASVSGSACACFPSTLLFAAYIIILILFCCAT